ncbi:MAG: methionyl-tRNA formyltransferase [Phycisphaerae bacterium]
MKFVFLGAGAFGIPGVEACAASTHQLCAVVTQPDKPAGRGQELAATAIALTADAYGWDLHKTDNVNSPEMIEKIRAYQPDCLVVIAFGQKLSPELLAVAPYGGINLHSSLLPNYRGAAPINWAIINNDPTSGCSVIQVTNVMDGGDILASVSTPIGADETAGELHERLANLGGPLLPQVLDAMANDTLARTPQEDCLSCRAPKLNRQMAWVDFAQPAALVSARFRGMSPWPGIAVEVIDPTGKVRTTATILKCKATNPTVGAATSYSADLAGHVLADRTVACGGGGALEIITIQPVGKKPMDLQAFANGYQIGAGWKLRSVVAVPGSSAS